jgi:hypothetical protein
MNYLDRDLNKLYKYINQLGLKLYIKKFSPFDGEAEYIVDQSITLFVNSKTSKASKILSLLHELGHHLDFIARKESKEETNALLALNKGQMTGERSDLTKKQLRVILKLEKAGVKYMTQIHKSLNLEIPFYKVKHQQEMDLFQYKFLYTHKRFANSKDNTKVYNKLKYYKKKYGK